MIDSYAHLGLPRFQSLADATSVMDASDIDRAVVCPFTSCPDFGAVHEAIRTAPDRFRGAGLPVGVERTQVGSAIAAQFAAGFAGLRLSTEDICDRGWLLDAIGLEHGFALVCGGGWLAQAAPALLRYLDRFEDGLVLGGHCADPSDPSIFQAAPAVAELFAHERFAVIVSRQAMYPKPLLREWMGELIGRVGWDRLLWGSEAPVLYWRDETIPAAATWIDQFLPSPRALAAFHTDNAQRIIFDRPVPDPAPLRLPLDPWQYATDIPAQMWPHGLPMASRLSARLVHGWIEWGGNERGPLRDYVQDILRRALPELPE